MDNTRLVVYIESTIECINNVNLKAIWLCKCHNKYQFCAWLGSDNGEGGVALHDSHESHDSHVII